VSSVKLIFALVFMASLSLSSFAMLLVIDEPIQLCSPEEETIIIDDYGFVDFPTIAYESCIINSSYIFIHNFTETKIAIDLTEINKTISINESIPYSYPSMCPFHAINKSYQVIGSHEEIIISTICSAIGFSQIIIDGPQNPQTWYTQDPNGKICYLHGDLRKAGDCQQDEK